jgi:predicted Ser/Thr protein kinase
MGSTDLLTYIDQIVRKDFESKGRVLSFDEYLSLVGEKPKLQLRGSAQYAADMMDYYGTLDVDTADGESTRRFNVFDLTNGDSVRRVVGQEHVQNHLYRSLKSFVRQGVNNRLVLLHGPNGSAKSSLIHSLMAGLEQYSQENEGAAYTFNWVFPVERFSKGGIGINTYATKKENVSSYAKLADEDILAKIPCDLKDHPILLIPLQHRRAFLEKLIGKKESEELWITLPAYLSKGEPCHRCKQIADALLLTSGGDYKKVLMHVQVERIFYSRRYRKGVVTIEPQFHVDAQYQQLTMNRSMGSLPASLQSLNLFALQGDLVDGNRGIIEYSDLLKRPVDTFKYLLAASETGAVNIGSTIAYLDTLMLGSTNELQLDAFKEFPDFTSFKARIDLIRVPYLLSVTQEKEIYQPDLKQIGMETHVAPHTGWALALWAVLTRLKKPNSINYPPHVSTIVSNLSPLEKAKLLDTGDMPMTLTAEDRKLLRSAMRKLREEYSNIPYYEGRMGASARELKSILFSAAQNHDFQCLSPLAVFRELEEFVKRVSEYDFLKQDVKDGFHDSTEFINTVRNEYLNIVDREVRDSIGLYDSKQWEDFLRKYIQHISLLLKKEKIKNPITGKMEDPDRALVAEFEAIVQAPAEGPELEGFRQHAISQVGAWALDHPGKAVTYAKVFPEFWHKLEKHYYESQKALLTKMHNALVLYGKESAEVTEEGSQLAEQTVNNMKTKLHYCEHCAKDVIVFLMRQRY